MTFAIRCYRDDDELVVVRLWEAAGLTRPWNDPRSDIARKRALQPELFLVGEYERTLIATVMAGYDGHRGWVHYLAVDPRFQGRGHARALMTAVEEKLARMGCVKLNLQVRSDNERVLAFYEHIGFAREERVSMGKRLRDD